MADREQSRASDGGMKEKPQDNLPKPHPTSGNKGEEHRHGVRDIGSVGHDAPDESKERNTEIAVEAGHKGPGGHRGDKR